MNKGDFITYISEKHSISKVEAEKAIYNGLKNQDKIL